METKGKVTTYTDMAQLIEKAFMSDNEMAKVIASDQLYRMAAALDRMVDLGHSLDANQAAVKDFLTP